MDPRKILDLPENATEADIRRAYARKLKVVRPDEDPDAFQKLVEARDLALAIAQNKYLYISFDETEDVSDFEDDGATHEQGQIDANDAQLETGSATDAIPPISETLNDEQDFANEHHGDQHDDGTTPTDDVSSPWVFLESIQQDFQQLIEHDIPLDLKKIDTALLQLPLGGAQQIEDDIIVEMSHVLERLWESPKQEAVVVSFEKLGLHFCQLFDWYRSDRAIHDMLHPEHVTRFENFLGSAHQQHKPDHIGRFGRKGPSGFGYAGSPLPKDEERGPWMLYLIICFFAFYGIAMAINNDARKQSTQSENSVKELLEQIRENHNDVISKLTFDPEHDSQLIKSHREQSENKPIDQIFTDTLVTRMADRYVQSGKSRDAIDFLDLVLQDTPEVSPNKKLSLKRTALWMKLNGWADRENCLRKGSRSNKPLSAERELTLKDDVIETFERFQKLHFVDKLRPGSASEYLRLTGNMLEVSDSLRKRKALGELSAFFDTLENHTALLAAPEFRSVAVEVATIRRCMLGPK